MVVPSFCRAVYSVADPGCLSGSRIRFFSIPDPNCVYPGSSSKNLSILTPKKAKKWFLSSKKYDPGCSSRIQDPDADFLPSRILDPGVKKAPNPGSQIRIRNTGPGYASYYSVGLVHPGEYTRKLLSGIVCPLYSSRCRATGILSIIV